MEKIGKISQIMGAVVDVTFEDGNLPEILNALNVDRGVYYAEFKKLEGGSGNDVFVIDYVTNGARKFDGDLVNGNDDNQDGTINWTEYYTHPLIIADFEQGVDKIGLRDGTGDWSGKTIVAVQGTGALSSHTLLFMGKSERGSDSDGYVWAILWNTTATDITADDFVLVSNDMNYTTSTLSGVTISNDASLASDATLQLTDDGNLNDDNGMQSSGLIDSSPSFTFENISSSSPVTDGSDFSDLLSESFVSDENNMEVVTIEELEEEEILVSIDII